MFVFNRNCFSEMICILKKQSRVTSQATFIFEQTSKNYMRKGYFFYICKDVDIGIIYTLERLTFLYTHFPQI